jgi:ligand-binding sensor domain-containing protein
MRTFCDIFSAHILQRVVSFTLLLFFCTLSRLPAQTPSYLPSQQLLFERLSYEQGLSESNVTAILQDKRGFLWIGTTNGLNRFDGYTFTIFRNTPSDSTTLVNNTVTALYEDHTGTLWVGTQNGLSAYNRSKGAFTTFVNAPSTTSNSTSSFTSISNNNIRALAEDADGNLWIGTKRGLNRLDAARKQFTVFKADKKKTDAQGRGKGPTDNEIVALHISPAKPHILWIGARSGGVNALDFRTMKFAAYPLEDSESEDAQVNSNGIAAMTADARGNLWIGTRTEGVFLFNATSHEFTPFANQDAPIGDSRATVTGDPLRGSLLSPLASSPANRTSAIHSLKVDADDNLWIGTRTGLWMLDNTRKNWMLHTNNTTDPNSLSDNDVNVIFQDRTGVLWFGTQNGGLSKFAPQSARFQVFKHNPLVWSGLHNGVVTALAENARKRGEIWVGTQNGLHTLLPNGELRPTDELNLYLGGMQILSLLHSRTGTLWIGTERGLIRAQANTVQANTAQANTAQASNDGHWTTTTYNSAWDNNNSLSDDVISALAEDAQGNIWVGTQGGGVNVLNPATNSFTRYLTDPENTRSLADNFVFSILCDEKGTIWIGTSNGLCRFDAATRDFTTFQRKKMGEKMSDGKSALMNNVFPNTPILAIHQHEGALWLGTLGGGLYRFLPKSVAITRFGKDEQLPSETVYGILHDSKKQLWLSTPRGLAMVSLPKNTSAADTALQLGVRVYNGSDGLHSNTFRQGASLLASNGMFAFGVGMGVVRFHPDSLRNNPVPPAIGFVRFRIFGSTELTSTIEVGDTISIDHSDNFEIEYAALDFTNIAKNQYAYFIEGLTKDWRYPGLVRTVTGTNLEPGTYQFRVKAANSDGVWNEAGATLTIIVRPPWWETWWFRIIAALAVVGAVVGGYQWRVRRINAQNELLTRLVEQRTFTLKEQSRLLEAQATEIQLANGALNEKNMELTIVWTFF